jgi:apolipoprotein N-acyltransferase
MSLNPGGKAPRSFLINLAALVLAMLLFAGAFPNPVNPRGFPFLAWFAYIPVFWVVRRVSFGASLFWGALYGYGAYGLFNYWLSVFHPLAGLIVGSIYLVYMTLLFPLLKGALLLFPRRGYLVQFLLWMAFEYLRTLGFLGYSYGISGYSQWNVLPLIQIAGIFGVWGVSALVVFPSAWAAGLFANAPVPPGGASGRSFAGEARAYVRREGLPLLLWAFALVLALIYGVRSPQDYSGAPKVRIALIQHNTDPWKGGIAEYRSNYRILKRLSLEALKEDPDLVVWSETAFVPRIYWHITYRDDPESWDLVKELLDFLAPQEIPFVLGNDDARREVSPSGSWERVDYNAAMLFEGGRLTEYYRKLHLVPFTEHFPYRKQLPWVYDALARADTHFWEKGKKATVFRVDSRGKSFSFSTPICFEDTFGYLSREFVRNGAELIVNLSNDAWSRSLPAQMQHLSMAVFRAVENRRAMVRSTASGQTCGIDPSGRILAMAEPFTESALTVEVPLTEAETFYTRYGDFLPPLFIALLVLLLIIRAASCIIGVIKKGSSAET